MTFNQVFIVSGFLYTLLFALLLILRPWRNPQGPRGNDLIAWRVGEVLVAIFLLFSAFFLVLSILLATAWANPNVPDTIAPRASYLQIAIPLLGLGVLLFQQMRVRRRSNSVEP